MARQVWLVRGSWLPVVCVCAGCATHAAPRTAPDASVVQLRQDLSAIFDAPIMSHAQWAVDIRSIDRDQPLFSVNAGKLMMPASNMKILTLAGAAEILGWDARLPTTLEAAGAVSDGVLHGDLVIRGTGDPTINTRNGRGVTVFADWANALRTAGVRSIQGRIVGDDQAFDDEGIGGGWAWDYLQYGYAAPVGALQYNEDVAELVVSPGATEREPAVIRLAPGTGLSVMNRTVTGAAGSAETIDYKRHLDAPILDIVGSVPLGGKPVTRSVAVVNPTVFFAQSLKDALVEYGIEVSGEAVDLDDIAAQVDPAAERRVLTSTESPSLSEIADVLMKVSQNLYAETLMKWIGRAEAGLGTFAAGRDAVQGMLRGWGIPDQSYVIADGSGLSRYNYVSAGALTAVLEKMYKDPNDRDRFLGALAVAGRDGTMATRLRRTRAEGNAAVKTGSISNVRSLSGFIRTRDGEMLVFSILANDFVVPSATVNWITDLAVEVLANFTRGQTGVRPGSDRGQTLGARAQ
ncbi:MAG: D-alanyl-D-alanine carboxypeptidase/D-alanyl-D-alanine-endopeptidase [Vicinamibacterales bacterium]